MAEKRESSDFKETEKARESSLRRTKRANVEYLCKERRNQTNSRKMKRIDKDYRSKEKNRDKSDRKVKRSDKDYRSTERSRDTSERKRKRTDEDYRSKERNRETSDRKMKRSDKDYRSTERRRETSDRKRRRVETECRLKATPSATVLHELAIKFHQTVQQGPCYICTCCNQLVYRHSVVTFEVILDKKLTFAHRIPQLTSADNKIWICKTCKSYLDKNKIPPMSVLNKMCFPEQGILKELNPLEQNLLAVRIPFMKFHEATRGRQKFIRGNMVLVPADVDNTVSKLPRMASNDLTIKATLKRRLQYKHHVYCVNIRPQLVKDCAQVLASKPLYKNYITVDSNWQQESVPDVDTQGDTEVNAPTDNATITTNSGNDKDNQSDDEWSEIDESEVMAGMSDTLLSAQDFIEPNERDMIYNFAPGEGSVPVSVFLEKDIEELAFPSIFCGESRAPNEERPVSVTYGEIVKSELRNRDRRAALLTENIFFKTKKLQMKILLDQAHLLLRKIQTKNQPLNVKDVRGASMNNLLNNDKAYKALASIRGSPPYFEKVSKDLFAMIRQLGAATFFLTLSAAETRWLHLLKILGEVVDNKIYSEEDVKGFTWEDKCRLIQSDPVTCARHFDFSVNKFLHEFLLSSGAPLGEIVDYFYRVEYQNRGSPHIHMMIWCKGAPSYGTDTAQDICDYVDKYISCALPEEDDPMHENVKLQMHRHSHTCRKKGKKICRFGFSKPLFDHTILLEPLSQQECTQNEMADHKKTWMKIQSALKEIDESEPISYNDFLLKLQITEEKYISAVRTSIHRPTIFLKRTYAETRVNNYNSSVLHAWRANIDVQFVLDVYACATYVASYLTKSQRGMSELLRKATNEAKQGNSDIRQQLKEVGNKFLNAVEISAQEACYICLQLPMKSSSRHVVFVNTSPPEERVTLLKPKHVLDTMKDDDENIECSNMLSRYAERPKSMENMSLAEFAAFYEEKKTFTMPRNKKLILNSVDKMLPESAPLQNEDNVHNDVDLPPVSVSCSTSTAADCPTTVHDTDVTTSVCVNESSNAVYEHFAENKVYRRRNRGHIIRSVHFNPDVDSEKYYRELIMLYYPWRDESTLIGECHTFCDRFKEIQTAIEECRQNYEPFAKEVDIAQMTLSTDPDLQDSWDELAPTTENQDSRDRESQPDKPDAGIEDYNIAGDLGLPITSSAEELHDLHELPDEDYRQHMRRLNCEQLTFVFDTIEKLRDSKECPLVGSVRGWLGVRLTSGAPK